ncbi:MAG: hypothetical protein PHI06_15045 [Desulfobulbaceae bacterium]|nr:hypothetical protein [Desulfobulbaceae bacterium]
MREFPSPEMPRTEAKDKATEQRERELKNAKEILKLISTDILGTENSIHGKFCELSNSGKLKRQDKLEAIYQQVLHFHDSAEALIRRQLGIKGNPEWDCFRYGNWEDYVSRYVDKSSPDYIDPRFRPLKNWDD